MDLPSWREFLDHALTYDGPAWIVHDWAWAIVATACALAAFFIWRMRRVGPARTVPLILLLLAIAGVTPWLRATIAERTGPGRMAVLKAMKARPHDPWPRSRGHVPLSLYGSPVANKAYVEPGGAFSPSPGSFGVSFWLIDSAGKIVATSDSIPIDQTEMRYVFGLSGEPGLLVQTPYYSASWMTRVDGGFDLTVFNTVESDLRLEIVIRGVGPAGGPLKRIEARDGAVRLNDAWKVTPINRSDLDFLGVEGGPGWKRSSVPESDVVESPSGWATVRIAAPSGVSKLALSAVDDPKAVDFPPLRGRLMLRGVDQQFEMSLRSQIATLAIGVVDDQTRPGDPLNYPLEWLRDGAYGVVALARAGQVELARRLALAAAPKDFFGGFGAEADAPGLGLWMLAETSAAVRTASFDQDIWPHVLRKAALIEEMLAARNDVRKAFVGPVVPKYAGVADLDLVAGPARDGLIDGRMDWERPRFFVNAVSYAGLNGAARIADRLGETRLAAEWRQVAADLRVAWLKAFRDPANRQDAEDDRTAISGLWPSEIAETTPFVNLLAKRAEADDKLWATPKYSPPWSYFTIAEAHQWLRVGRVDRVWGALARLRDVQPAPGVFTFAEGQGEENSFGIWNQLRGWVRPPNVTPHYWSAAEMLLLQLSMLAETQGPPGAEELVIGPGVPKQWTSHGLAVRGVGVSFGTVDWSWDGSHLAITMHGGSMPVRIGPGFPKPDSVIIDIRDGD